MYKHINKTFIYSRKVPLSLVVYKGNIVHPCECCVQLGADFYLQRQDEYEKRLQLDNRYLSIVDNFFNAAMPGMRCVWNRCTLQWQRNPCRHLDKPNCSENQVLS